MGLDIRWPIGLMFSTIGLLLVGYGLAANPTSYQCSLGINIDLGWGVLLLVFGGVMLALAKRGAAKTHQDKP